MCWYKDASHFRFSSCLPLLSLRVYPSNLPLFLAILDKKNTENAQNTPYNPHPLHSPSPPLPLFRFTSATLCLSLCFYRFSVLLFRCAFFLVWCCVFFVLLSHAVRVVAVTLLCRTWWSLPLSLLFCDHRETTLVFFLPFLCGFSEPESRVCCCGCCCGCYCVHDGGNAFTHRPAMRPNSKLATQAHTHTQ